MTAQYAKPLPKITPLNKGFWDAAAKRKLSMQHCKACGDMHFPPGPICPNCLSKDQEWVEVSGKGTLQSWIDFHRAYWPSFNDSVPYRVCLVQLAEGPLLISNLEGDSSEAELGAAVEVVFEEVTPEITLPKFVLSSTISSSE